jgi:hypothetical protein
MRVLAILAALTISAAAEDAPRLINFDAVLQVVDGGDMVECTKFTEPEPGKEKDFIPVCLEKKPVRLGMVAYRALSKSKPGQSLNDASARWRLSHKVDHGTVELSAPDVTTIINAIHEHGGFSGEVVGQSICMVDPTFCKDK